MLEKVKLALRISTNAFDVEITDLIHAALADLCLAGVVPPDPSEGTDTSGAENGSEGLSEAADPDPVITDPLVIRAVITYCKAHFGEAEQYDRLKSAYDEQKAQLRMATGYTDWGET